MTLSGVLKTAVDDLVELAGPWLTRSGGGPRLVARAEGEALALYEVSPAGASKRLPASARKRVADAVELRLPAEAVLARTLTLPAAGRDFVEPIIDHRLEKLTPWAPERALYGYRVTGEAPSGELTVDFAATSRDIADAWIAKAEAAGLVPSALGSAAEPMDKPLAVDLWRGARDRAQLRARRIVARAGLAAAVVLIPAVFLSAWTSWSAESRLADVEARSAAARRALQVAAGAGAGSREAALIGAKRPDAAMVTLIDRLARAVPKDTSLRDLEIDGERIRLSGSSAAAPALIGRLEASGLMRETRFAAPVTRTPDGRDAFEILAARVRPEPPQAAAAQPGAGL